MIATMIEALAIEKDYKYRSSCAIGDMQFKESEEDEAKKVVPATTNRRNLIRRSYSQNASSLLRSSDHSLLAPPASVTRNTTGKKASSSRSPQRPSLSTRASSTRRMEANQKKIHPLSQSEHVGSNSRGAAIRRYASNRASTEHLSEKVTQRSRIPSGGGGGGRRRNRSGVDPLSQSEHVQRNPNMMHRPQINPTNSSSVQQTTLELLDLIKKRRRREAARLHRSGVSIRPDPKPIQRHRSMDSATGSPSRTTAAILSQPPSKQQPRPIQRHRSMGSATASPPRTSAAILPPPSSKHPSKPIHRHHSMGSVTDSPPRTPATTTTTTTAILSPPPSKQPPKRIVDDSESSDSDEESSQDSPKSVLNFPKGGGGRKDPGVALSPQISLLYPKPTEEEKERMRLEKKQKQQEVDRMKLEMEQMQQRLAEIEHQKELDLAQLQESQKERKAKMKALAKAKLVEHLETEQLAIEVETKRMVALQEQLEEEQEKLKSTKTEWKEANKGLIEEKDQLQAANDQLFNMYTHLTKWVQKKTLHNAKLVPAEAKLVKILKGSISLIVEAKLSKTYRKWMYKCAKAVNTSDMYDFELDEGIFNIIRECETECNKEVIPMMDVDEWIVQQQQQDAEEEDPMLEFMQTLQQQQEQGPTTNQDLRPMERPSSKDGGGGGNESSSLDNDEDDNNFEDDMEELDQSMKVHEQVLADISEKLDATQMSTLYENKQMLLTIFRFLDTDKSGDIDADEFSFGIELLNKRLPEESQFREHEELFQLLDVDGNGTIDIQEFERIFIDQNR
eukprot:scaffold2190_cov72-Cylindrotheca_fusiformis.AAC.6